MIRFLSERYCPICKVRYVNINRIYLTEVSTTYEVLMRAEANPRENSDQPIVPSVMLPEQPATSAPLRNDQQSRRNKQSRTQVRVNLQNGNAQQIVRNPSVVLERLPEQPSAPTPLQNGQASRKIKPPGAQSPANRANVRFTPMNYNRLKCIVCGVAMSSSVALPRMRTVVCSFECMQQQQ